MPRRIVFVRRGEVALESFQLPELGSTDVLVTTRYSMISLGTESTILQENYAPESHFARMFGFPQYKTGVLATGVVERMGKQADAFEKGDRVFMRMAHGSHQVLPEAALTPVPESVSSRDACWCGLAKTAFRAAWAGCFAQTDSVLIIGAGPVGQMLVRWANTLSLKEIAVVDPIGSRLDHALRGGATHLCKGLLSDHLDPLRALGGSQGPALVVDCTGNAAVFADALAVVRRFGKVVLLGDSGHPNDQRLTSDAMTKGLTIQATHESHDLDGWTQAKVDARFFEAVSEQQFDLSGLVTHAFRPDQCREAYSLVMDKSSEAMGIVFDWTS